MDFLRAGLVWSQASSTPASSSTSQVFLALKRWCYGLTLCSPDPIPSARGLIRLMLALGVLIAVTVAIQGPATTFRQLVSVSGLFEAARSGLARVFRASRLIMVLVTFTVLSWTLGEMTLFNRANSVDLTLLERTRSPSEIATEQGELAALTPFRDLAGLADNLPWLIVAGILVFRASSQPPEWRFEHGPGNTAPDLVARAGFATAVWGSAGLYALYRLIAWGAGSIELPRGSILVVETLLVPASMLIVDGFLLAWLLVELRDARPGLGEVERFQVNRAVALLPAALVACFVALPARHIAILVLLASSYLPTTVASTNLGGAIRSLLGWGLVDLQMATFWALGVVGATAWTRGSIGEIMQGYWRLTRSQGGRVAAILIVASAACGVASGATYAVMLLLPPRSWVLAAADAYAHFATLPVGLWALATLVDLSERVLPVAELDTPLEKTAAREALATASD